MYKNYGDKGFGRRLKASRLKCGFSQQKLGDKIGVNNTFISQCERGTKLPTLLHTKSIAKILGVSIDWLIGL